MCIRDRLRQVWDWGLGALAAIELNHRSYVDQNDDDILAFRDRKAVEFYAARYLTQFASDWDIFADNDPDHSDSPDNTTPCAWHHTADSQWDDTWKLAIDMPQLPLPGNWERAIRDCVLDPLTTCRSLSALFKRIQAEQSKARRPTELIYRCWHLFAYDHDRSLDCRYRVSGKMLTGRQLLKNGREDDLRRWSQDCVLGERGRDEDTIQLRQQVLDSFRRSSQELVSELEQRLDTILVTDTTQSVRSWVQQLISRLTKRTAAGERKPIPVDPSLLRRYLSKWQQQSWFEKSRTMLQCPPQQWIDAYEAGELGTDPRINAAIQDHESDLVEPVQFQATPVTRGMYQLFDPHFDTTEYIAEELTDVAPKHFPMIRASWFDAWVFLRMAGRSVSIAN